MPKTIVFTLAERWDAPATLGFDLGNAKELGIPNGKYSRHHIAGRKYMSMLLELLTAFELVTVQDTRARRQDWNIGTCDDRIKKFASYAGNAYNALAAAFFWSPWNLFVGPAGDYRAFDPSSGVEPVKPLNFPDARWKAVKAIPVTLEKLGVPLANLVKLDNGADLRFTALLDDGKAKDELRALLDGFAGMMGAHGGKPYRFSLDEWAVVDTAKDVKKVLNVASSAQAEMQFTMAGKEKLIQNEKTWADVANQQPGQIRLKMILRTV